MRDGKEPQDRSSGEISPTALAGLGMQFAVALLGFGYAGNWMDARLHTSPLFLMAGVFLGGGGSFYASYRRLTRAGSAATSSDASSAAAADASGRDAGRSSDAEGKP